MAQNLQLLQFAFAGGLARTSSGVCELALGAEYARSGR